LHTIVGIGAEAHNTFISILAETGLVGFVIFISMLFVVFNEIMRMPQEHKRLWLAAICIWGIGANLLTLEYKKATWIILSLVIIDGTCLREQVRSTAARLGLSRPTTVQPADGQNQAII
jgi:hypothetical protein